MVPNMLRRLFLLVGILILVGLVLGGSFVWDTFVIRPKEGVESVEVVIEPGSSVAEIADELAQQDLVTSKWFFKVYVVLTKQSSDLQAGTFLLPPGMNIHALVAELTHAQALETQITIPEGFTVEQIREELEKSFDGFSQTDWQNVVEDGSGMDEVSEMLASIPNGQGLEGYLFPDTYQFRADADAQTIAQTMILTLKRRLAEHGVVVPEDLVFDNGLTLHEVLTMASIIEREVRTPEDMAMVAGIFFTRLKIGMALQADSTVNYVTGKQNSSISVEDSQIESPYNTYRNLGLPPGPISNPGMNAILAVLQPETTSYLYFLTTEEGKTIYASSFDEHVENKYRYLR